MAQPLWQTSEDRVEPRDEVYRRTRITLADRRTVPGIVVNLSPHGLMVRVEAQIAAGEWIKVELPVVGTLGAAVRWSLGGRVGCQFEQAINPGAYDEVLALATN